MGIDTRHAWPADFTARLDLDAIAPIDRRRAHLIRAPLHDADAVHGDRRVEPADAGTVGQFGSEISEVIQCLDPGDPELIHVRLRGSGGG